MWQNPQETADLVTFTEEIFHVQLHFLRSAFKLEYSEISNWNVQSD